MSYRRCSIRSSSFLSKREKRQVISFLVFYSHRVDFIFVSQMRGKYEKPGGEMLERNLESKMSELCYESKSASGNIIVVQVL